MGAHVHLNMTISAIDSLSPSLPEWKKVLLRTLATYGAYINDTTTSRFYFSWQLESGLQYTSMDVPEDPWLAWAASLTTPEGTNDWWDWSDAYGSGYKGLWNSADGIQDWYTQVWSNLRVLSR